MSHADSIKTLFTADSGAGGMAALLTGGIYTFADTGRNGISQIDTPNAFSTSTGQLKPCCVIKQRSMVPFGGINDEVAQLQSMRAVVELWFYDNGNAALTTLTAAQARAHLLLHGKQVGNARALRINKIDDQRDPSLDRAHLMRRDYEFHNVE